MIPAHLDRLWKRWRPSTRLRHDPLAGHVVGERYHPVTVANLKVVPATARRVLLARESRDLTLSPGKNLTVLIPFRDRDEHLARVLPRLRAILERQGIPHRILVVEQESGKLFNRGKLLNVGMQLTAPDSDYFCFHDVDMLPVEATYLAPSEPLRLIHRLQSTWRGLSVFAAHYFGGVVSVGKEQIFAANGFSNEYWGWGHEDDDVYVRLLLSGSVPYYDSNGTYEDLPNPKAQQVDAGARVKPPFLKRNRARRSDFFRGLSNPALDGLSHLTFTLLDRRTEAGHERVHVRI